LHILEQDQVHGSVHLVVVLESVGENLVKLWVAGDGSVLGLANSMGEVAPDVRLLEALFLVHLLQISSSPPFLK